MRGSPEDVMLMLEVSELDTPELQLVMSMASSCIAARHGMTPQEVAQDLMDSVPEDWTAEKHVLGLSKLRHLRKVDEEPPRDYES